MKEKISEGKVKGSVNRKESGNYQKTIKIETRFLRETRLLGAVITRRKR
jgi:hypothetical protein